MKNLSSFSTFLKKTCDKLKNLFSLKYATNSLDSEETPSELSQDLEKDNFYFDEEGKDFLHHMLQARRLTAEDIMVPRVDIVAIDETADLKEITVLLEEKPHHYFPVYRNSLDEIVGAVNIKALFLQASQSCLQQTPFKLERSLKKVLFVSPAMRLFDLLHLLQQRKANVALVVDEYGGVDGLVSLHDIIKELISDFENKTQFNASMKLIHRSDGSYLADGRLELEELENKFSAFLTEEERAEDIDTLGGLVSFLFGRVPNKGEIIRHSSDLEFEVIDADPRRVKTVIIRYSNTGQNSIKPTQV